MIEYISYIPVRVIKQELDHCEESMWHDTKAWSNPADMSNSTLSSDACMGESAIREQDRLHVIWQTNTNGFDQSWWLDPNWRSIPPSHTPHARFFSRTLQIIENFCQKSNLRLNRMFFSRLRAGKAIYPHRDVSWGQNFASHERLGLVISTNADCVIKAGNDTAHPTEGTVFRFDHNDLHSAQNQGLSDRIILYMDTKPLAITTSEL